MLSTLYALSAVTHGRERVSARRAGAARRASGSAHCSPTARAAGPLAAVRTADYARLSTVRNHIFTSKTKFP